MSTPDDVTRAIAELRHTLHRVAGAAAAADMALHLIAGSEGMAHATPEHLAAFVTYCRHITGALTPAAAALESVGRDLAAGAMDRGGPSPTSSFPGRN